MTRTRLLVVGVLALCGVALTPVVSGHLVAGDATATVQEDSYVTGEVTTQSGDPVTGLTIDVVDVESDTVVATPTTDGSGEFGPIQLAPGNYTVESDRENYTTYATQVSLDAGETETIFVTQDSILGTIRGEVTTGSGDPVTDQPIDIVDLDDETVAATTTTDGSGEFGPIDLPTGNYTVTTDRENYTTYATQVFLEPDETETIFVTQESTLGVVRGEVTTQNGDPVGGLTVDIVDVDSDSVVATPTTDGNGDFGPVELQAGTYTAESDRENYTTYATQVSLEAEETETIFVTQDSTLGFLRGEVATQNGDPVSDLRVDVVDVGDGSVVATPTTDSNGEFGPIELPSGTYTVQSDRENYTTYATQVTLDPDESETVFVTQDSTLGLIRGEVSTQNGDPVSGLAVDLVDLDENAVVARPTTDGSGRIAPFEVPAGNYTVQVDTRNYTAFATRVQLSPDETETVLVTAESKLGVVEGAVSDTNGDPVQGATVTVQNGSGAVVASLTSGTSGAFGGVSLPADSYRLVAAASGYREDTTRVQLDANRRESVSLTLTATVGIIEGRVRDRLNQPLANATVVVEADDGTVVNRTRTDQRGTYALSVPVGEYTVAVSRPDGETVRRSATVERDDTVSQGTVTLSAATATETTSPIQTTATGNDRRPTTGVDDPGGTTSNADQERTTAGVETDEPEAVTTGSGDGFGPVTMLVALVVIATGSLAGRRRS